MQLAPRSLQLQSPCRAAPHYRAEDGDCRCRISHSTKAHSPLITDFITPETGGLGRKEIADCWSLPFQKEASWGERGGCQRFDSRDLTICLTSDSLGTDSVYLQSGQQDQAKERLNLDSGTG